MIGFNRPNKERCGVDVLVTLLGRHSEGRDSDHNPETGPRPP
jgi:hypothetical protein